MTIDKPRLLQALLDVLEDDLALQTRAANLARDEATNEESRADNKYDTRGQEAAYLAEGQAKIATELLEAIALYRTLKLSDDRPPAAVTIGTVIEINRAGSPLFGFLGPRCGGTAFEFENVSYTVITPVSPLGRALLGRRRGETFYLSARGKPQAHVIVQTG